MSEIVSDLVSLNLFRVAFKSYTMVYLKSLIFTNILVRVLLDKLILNTFLFFSIFFSFPFSLFYHKMQLLSILPIINYLSNFISAIFGDLINHQ